MTAGLRIRRLQLRGAGRTYDVSFLDADGTVRPISVIAGEIATGKTSILELIDYCLGASRHPRHPEIQRRARAALLEIEYGDSRAVIERPLGSYSKAYVHHASLDAISDDYHDIETKTLQPASDEDSLSTFLLRTVDLAGRSLKQAPTQDASAVDRFSFRDLSDLFFLPHRRLDNLELLHERHQPRRLKLRQTIDLIFGAHDDALVAANARLDEAQHDIDKLKLEIDTISTYLREQGVDEDHDLGRIEREAEQDLGIARSALAQLESEMASETTSADELRSKYDRASSEVTRLTTTVRDRDTLLRRLGALRAQYADDLLKLRFAEEAGRLFDPLALTACPSCLQPLDQPAGPRSGECGLCAQTIEPIGADHAFDVTKEIRTTETKLRELGASMDGIDQELAETMRDLDGAKAARDNARAELDEAVAARLAPFISQRDMIRDRVSGIEQRTQAIERTRSLIAGLEARRSRLTELQTEEQRLRSQIDRLRQQGQDHEYVVAALSARFGSILGDFDFPKLDEPRIDSFFTPFVRGMRYSELGSAGTATLVALAWHLAIFEEATVQEALHPGFLLIDSPQKNLMSDEEPDFDGDLIGDSIYAHLTRWAASEGSQSQLIIVDNAPRDSGQQHVVVRYSGDPDRPPYGLIDDEVPWSPA